MSFLWAEVLCLMMHSDNTLNVILYSFLAHARSTLSAQLWIELHRYLQETSDAVTWILVLQFHWDYMKYNPFNRSALPHCRFFTAAATVLFNGGCAYMLIFGCPSERYLVILIICVSASHLWICTLKITFGLNLTMKIPLSAILKNR